MNKIKVMVRAKKTGLIGWFVVSNLKKIDQRSYEILVVREKKDGK